LALPASFLHHSSLETRETIRPGECISLTSRAVCRNSCIVRRVASRNAQPIGLLTPIPACAIACRTSARLRAGRDAAQAHARALFLPTAPETDRPYLSSQLDS